MGGALLPRWLHTETDITVVRPSGKAVPGTEQITPYRLVRNATELEDVKFDVLVIATKPQIIREVVPGYQEALKKDALVVSIAAGFSVASLADVAGSRPIVRIMPNMPVAIGEGFSTMFANDLVTSEQRVLVTELMANTGSSLWVDEEDCLDRATAVAGSGPGYVFEIARCWVEAGKSLGFSDSQAKKMVLQTLLGAVKSAEDDPRSLTELRNNVTSKNGTTAAGLAALNGDSGLDDLFDKTVRAAYHRAVELR